MYVRKGDREGLLSQERSHQQVMPVLTRKMDDQVG